MFKTQLKQAIPLNHVFISIRISNPFPVEESPFYRCSRVLMNKCLGGLGANALWPLKTKCG